jgi:hypothetical protein
MIVYKNISVRNRSRALILICVAVGASGCASYYQYTPLSANDPTIKFESADDVHNVATYVINTDPENDTSCKNYKTVNVFALTSGMPFRKSETVKVHAAEAIGVGGFVSIGQGNVQFVCRSDNYLLIPSSDAQYVVSTKFIQKKPPNGINTTVPLFADCPLKVEKILTNGEKEDVMNKLTKLPPCQVGSPQLLKESR